MEAKTVMCSYLSRKMSKVRWQPNDDLPCSKFLTGSWGEPSQPLPNIEEVQGNAVQLWKYVPNMEPIPLCTMEHPGDVTELKFLDTETFLVSSSHGSLQLGQVENDKDETFYNIKSLNSWANIHSFKNGAPSSLTSFARSKNGVVTVGDDGKLAVIALDNPTPLFSIEDPFNSSLKCVSFINHKSFITGNSLGNLKVWDVSGGKPQSVFNLPSTLKLVSINFIQQKPSQQHLLFVGSDDGSITVWDMRNTENPIILNTSHNESVSELQFHPENPNHFFTCSSLGELWHWDMKQDSSLQQWCGDTLNERLNVTALAEPLYLPLNSLDVVAESVITTCDNEATYIISKPLSLL
uniref:Nucleoporin Nup43 n=1 Tax=Cacopsylla melanoneura TaxID=428564 RepID=A0A8D8LR84_9HEMI